MCINKMYILLFIGVKKALSIQEVTFKLDFEGRSKKFRVNEVNG